MLKNELITRLNRETKLSKTGRRMTSWRKVRSAGATVLDRCIRVLWVRMMKLVCRFYLSMWAAVRAVHAAYCVEAVQS
jgi:hypothetical protein